MANDPGKHRSTDIIYTKLWTVL